MNKLSNNKLNVTIFTASIIVYIFTGLVFAQDRTLELTPMGSPIAEDLEDIFVDDNHAYLACGSRGFIVINVEDPSNPYTEGSCAVNGEPRCVNLYDGFAYIGIVNGLYKVNISNPANPYIIDSCQTSIRIYDIYIEGDYAYTACDIAGLLIIELSSMTIVGSCDTVGIVNEVHVSENYAYLSRRYDGAIQKVDVSDIYHPFLSETIETPGDMLSIFVEGDNVFAVDGNLQIAEISTSTLLDQYITPDSTKDVYICDSFAFLADDDSGLLVVDVEDPYNPTFAANYNTQGDDCYDTFVENEYVYITVEDDDNDQWLLEILHFELTNSIGETEAIPNTFSLSQNYPNPFNPTTTITYSLPAQSHVNVVIYDILGRQVETLIDTKQQAGNHQAVWNANSKPSGMYFYKIKAGDFIETKKMLLLK